jgi:hypothetical protein
MPVRRVVVTVVCVVVVLTVLSGCQPEMTAGITARIVLFGGLMEPGGGMALNGAPAVGVASPLVV